MEPVRRPELGDIAAIEALLQGHRIGDVVEHLSRELALLGD